MFGEFNRLFTSTLDTQAPIKSIKVRGRPHPFIDSEIKRLMKARDRLLSVFRKSRHPIDWEHYIEYRNSVKRKLKEVEANYYHAQIQKHRGNTRAIWKTIRQCIPSKESSKASYHRDTSVIADEFNAFFTSVGRTTAERVEKLADQHGIPLNDPILPLRTSDHIFDFEPATADDIKKIIASMPSNKAPGPDKIGIQALKDSPANVIQALTGIINSSLATSSFPLSWKLAEVIPLHKEGDHEVPSNNRPLSLLSVFSKVCEKFVLNQFSSYLHKHKLLSGHQSGNRKLHSTETLNIAVTDTFLEAMDSKQISILILIDLSKAFDSVQHDILLQKISCFGASPTVLNWFKSYLSERHQYIRIGTTFSSSLPLTHGIPQGSILSPFLFSIYTDDLPSVPKTCTLESYVDDSKVFISFPLTDLDSCLSSVKEDLLRVANWCCQNRLLINPDKTKMLLLGTRQLLKQLSTYPTLDFLGETISPVQCARDLGLIIDSNLSFNDHVQHLSSSCIAKLSQVNRARHAFNKETLLVIINALVMSRIDYCSAVWSSTTDTNLKKVQLIQNYAARIVSGTRKYDHITPVLRELKWLPIKQRLELKNAVIAFKCINGLAPQYLCSKFSKRKDKHKYATRNKEDLHINKYRTASGQRTFLYRATKIWNSLDTSLKSIVNITTFKKKLKSIMIQKFIDK